MSLDNEELTWLVDYYDIVHGNIEEFNQDFLMLCFLFVAGQPFKNKTMFSYKEAKLHIYTFRSIWSK